MSLKMTRREAWVLTKLVLWSPVLLVIAVWTMGMFVWAGPWRKWEDYWDPNDGC